MAADDNVSGLRVASFSCYLSNPEDSFVHKLNGGAVEPAFISPPETPFSVTKVTAAKAATAKPSSNNTKDNLANLRVESLSNYLKTGEDSFAIKTSGAPVQDPTIAFVFPQQASFRKAKQLEQSKSKDGEISIFGADKYFNIKWIMALLLQPDKAEEDDKMRCLPTFGCQPCLNKKAVFVDGSIGLGISQPGSKHWNDHNQSIEEQRKSIEVFGSGKMGKGDIAVNLDRKLSMLTWDAIPKSQNLPTTTNGSSTACDDMASDASSDLFEIENISGSGYGLVDVQTSGDYMSSSCMSPTTEYAPSKASIEWSVVTASAADYLSVISDYDEKNFGIGGYTSSRNAANRTTTNKNPVGKEVQKTRPSTRLLGCKSHKAVNVAETVHKTCEKVKQR
ncbi:hypothetical protein K7X08_034652 [Anisodus acutangulus]|uniref:Uncharacterized protein n=1 Tax=Anisodus acutangulus TaxID=402998 RepID=A0A9Q1R1L9_9SOLA|nr:hypothetical protein K7X08_034652 [Anisodus acutangulus]